MSMHSTRRTFTDKVERHRVQSSGRPQSISFLFVVNEVDLTAITHDSWGHVRPPTHAAAFANEVPSLVMRYQDGVVDAVSDVCYWHRRTQPHREEGVVIYQTPDGETHEATTYKVATVASCHSLMPFAMTAMDAFVHNTKVERGQPTWQPLQFVHGEAHMSGVSQVAFNGDFEEGATRQYVAGRRPNWIPSLVPRTYANPYVEPKPLPQDEERPPPSVGLGGDLTILLALMAFSEERVQGGSRADVVFPGPHGRWRHNRWLWDREPEGYALSTREFPQALVVYVAFDPFNEEGSNEDVLQELEFGSVLVSG